MQQTRRLPLERWPDDPQVLERGPDARPRAARLARGLGWSGLALAAVGLLASRRRARSRRELGLAIAGAAAVLVVGALVAAGVQRRQSRRRPPRDYSDRSGFQRPPGEMRGALRAGSGTATASSAPALRETVEDQTRPLH